MTPKDRDELAWLMAEARWVKHTEGLDPLLYHDFTHMPSEDRKGLVEEMFVVLDDMEAAGVAQVPMEATEEMGEALFCNCASCRSNLSAAIAANPYRSKP